MTIQSRIHGQLRLGSYNIRKAVGLDWRRDPMRIIRVINRMDVDVLALQEADRRLGLRPAALDPRMIERETDLCVAPLARSPVSLGWHGNAILVRKGLEIGAVDHIVLPGMEPRGGVLVRIGTGPQAVTVVGVHLGLRRACRRLQFAKILTSIGEKALDRAVILGDFNEWAVKSGLETLSPDFEVVSPGRSFHSARPVAALDRIALGKGISLYDAGLEEGPEARIASDHLPVWANLDLRNATDTQVREALRRSAF
jgi:endonuclease/exonuclease/phosphatase family metal-dependent hydrolase